MSRRHLVSCCVWLLTLTAWPPAPTWARKSSPDVPLAYRPTTAVAEASAAPTSEMRAVPVALVVTDERGLADPAVIGSRSDDDDRRSDLRATTEVAAFVESALAKQAGDWGFVLAGASEAGVLLVGRLTQLRVEETNQAVGASYKAEVTLETELRGRDGERRASGSFFGDASRYGKKFSNENLNEVLSDALAEALASALGDPSVRAAWGGAPVPELAGGAREPITPEAALTEVKAQMARGAGEAAVQDYLRRQTLTRALGAADLAAWKDAGVPEAVIRVAMTARVR